MGFWSTVGGAAKAVGETAIKTSQDIQKYNEEYEYKDDDFLKKKAKSGSVAEKAAAVKILKSRGHTSLD